MLMIIAIEMLFDKRQQRKEEDVDLNSDNVSVFPLATPIVAGPAAITSVIVSVSDIGTNFTNQTAGMFALVFVLFLTFIIFFIASKFSKIINKKIIGILYGVDVEYYPGVQVQENMIWVAPIQTIKMDVILKNMCHGLPKGTMRACR